MTIGRRYAQGKYTVEGLNPYWARPEVVYPKERLSLRLLWWLHVPFAFVADFLLCVRVEIATPPSLRRWRAPWRSAVANTRRIR